MNILHKLGLMKRSEHDEYALDTAQTIGRLNRELGDAQFLHAETVKQRDEEIERSFKALDRLNEVGDQLIAARGERDEAWETIKKQVDEIERLTERAAIAEAWAKEQHGFADKYAAEIASLRPDALKWRNSLERSRKRKSVKREMANG